MWWLRERALRASNDLQDWYYDTTAPATGVVAQETQQQQVDGSKASYPYGEGVQRPSPPNGGITVVSGPLSPSDDGREAKENSSQQTSAAATVPSISSSALLREKLSPPNSGKVDLIIQKIKAERKADHLAKYPDVVGIMPRVP